MLDLIIGAVLVGIALHEDKADEAKEAEAIRIAKARAYREESELRAQQQMLEKKALSRTNTLNELYAKLAICCYIAWADRSISPAEKHQLDTVYMEIYNSFPNDQEVRNELQRIYSTPGFSFIHLEKYLHKISPETIASFLEVAEEIASCDGYSSEEERLCIYKIRKYLTNRTGHDYTGIFKNAENHIDLKCPCCYATMELQPHNGVAVCQYCGNIKYLSANLAPIKPNASKTVIKSAQAVSKITFKCPVCMTLLSANKGTVNCICAKCNTRMKINNGQASVW